MGLEFTVFVDSLEPGREPDSVMFEAVWDKLRDTLIHEVRKRGLWNSPPSYLGVCGWASWTDSGALDELLAECYASVFLERLPSLKAQLEVKDNVEGLVFRNVRNFLYDMQKRNDPLGFRTFITLRRAVRQLIRAGRLFVLAGEPRILNNTVLGFDPGPAAPDPERGARLTFHVQEWCDELLPDLVTARGKVTDAVVARLAGHVLRLSELGFRSFCFEELAQPLKREVRRRWNAIGSDSEGEKGLESDIDHKRIVRVVGPDRDVEERDAFEKLAAQVTAELATQTGSSRTGLYLHRLWSFLKLHASEAPEDRPPSRRKVARRLGIPRDRLAELYDSLGRHVRDCRRALAETGSW